MTEPPSIVTRGERAFDDLKGLWKRRPVLCVIVLIAICLPTALYCVDRFWGRSQLSSELNSTKQKLQDAERDRDSKATQLAPFLALANSRYENAPEGKRLELLLDRLEAVTQTLLQIAKPVGRRELSAEAMKQIQGKLDFVKAIPISITTPIGGDGTGKLAAQLKQLFENEGFKVESSVGFFTEQPTGLIVQAKPPLAPELEDTLLLVFKDLGEEPRFYQDDNLSDGRVSIIVGVEPK